jgi:hypothetical protein
MPDTETAAPPIAELAVDRKELADALRILTRNVKVARAGEAIIRFAEGYLVIRIGGAQVRARASGDWPGEARLPGGFLLVTAKLLPASDLVPIRVKEERFYFAGSSVKCVWQRSGGAVIEIPIGATLPMILRIAREHTREAIEASGIAEVVDAAFKEENDLIGRAAAILAQLGSWRRTCGRWRAGGRGGDWPTPMIN